MATKELWINLPVKNVSKAKDFFSSIGFSFNEAMSQTEDSACMLVGQNNLVVMLFKEDLFKGFTQNSLTDTNLSSEVLFSFDAESKEEVDDMAKKIVAAGGDLFAPPSPVMGTMYGCAFCDLDGHRWNILFMNQPK